MITLKTVIGVKAWVYIRVRAWIRAGYEFVDYMKMLFTDILAD